MPHDRPLNKHTVTEGSVLVLPAYPLAFTLIGMILLLQDDTRTSGPAFDSAKFIMSWTPDPILTWALVFLVVAALEWGALLTQRRAMFKWLLVVGCGIAACWAFLLLSSAVADPLVSFTGCVWVGLGSYAHVASVRSLARDVVMK